MPSDDQSAVAEEPRITVRPKDQKSESKPRELPLYAVIVMNDAEHTFDYVIETFMKVFGYRKEKCFLLAEKIHNEGRGIVWSGAKEVAELKRDQIRGVGPDFYATKKVEFPLGVYIEPLPGTGR